MKSNVVNFDFYSQHYLEELLLQRYPSLKVNNIVPWQHTSKTGETVNPFPSVERTAYYGYLVAPGSGLSLVPLEGSETEKYATLNGRDISFPLLFTCLQSEGTNFGDIRFVGWKIAFENEIFLAPSPTPPIATPMQQGFKVFLYCEKDALKPVDSADVLNSDFGNYWVANLYQAADLYFISAKDLKRSVPIRLAGGGAMLHAGKVVFDYSRLDYSQGIYYELVNVANSALIERGFAPVGAIQFKIVDRILLGDGSTQLTFEKMNIPGVTFSATDMEVVDLTDEQNPVKLGDLLLAELGILDFVPGNINAGGAHATDVEIDDYDEGVLTLDFDLSAQSPWTDVKMAVGESELGRLDLAYGLFPEGVTTIELDTDNKLYYSDGSTEKELSGFYFTLTSFNGRRSANVSLHAVGGTQMLPGDFVNLSSAILSVDVVEAIPENVYIAAADIDYTGVDVVGYRWKLDFTMFTRSGTTEFIYSRNNLVL